MISVEEAIGIVLAQTTALAVESIDIDHGMGRILAEDLIADTDLPPFNRAQMDGYAVRSSDVASLPARLVVVGEAVAGKSWHGTLGPGEAVRIMTGAPVPSGADSVQRVEVTSEHDSIVEIHESTLAGQSIIDKASEIRTGQVVIPKGTRLNAAMMAALAAFGYATPKVYRRPALTVIPTGSELVAVDQKPGADQIRDSNGFSIAAYAHLAGAISERAPATGDNPELLKRQISDAANRSDVVVLSGGVSMGKYDFTKPVLKELGAEIFFERVNLRPGKPTVFARLGNTAVFGLPGNPVSVAVTFNLFARTAILAMQGANLPLLEETHAILTRDTKGSIDRASYLPATLTTDRQGRQLCEPLKWGGSSDFVSFTRSTALLIIPTETRLATAGEVVRVLKLPT
jgi:molybdopterin molybdotransferase